MKIDRSLEEVWEWKDKCYEEYKDKTSREVSELINKNAEEFKKNYNVKLPVIKSPEEMKTNSEIKLEGYQALVNALGYVYTEKFIALLQQEPFDYTLWQKKLWEEEGVEDLSRKAMKYLQGQNKS